MSSLLQHATLCGALAPQRRAGLRAPSQQPRRVLVRAEGGSPVSEDVLARLRQAEEEAARLKKELAAAQAAAGGAAADAGERAEAAAKRIDGGDLRRETLFSGVESRQRNWLSESDVSFFTGGGPGEADGEVSQEEQGVVQRRLILGLVAAVGLGAFGLIPTQQLQLSKPSKPLFFYLVPLLRSQQLLSEAEAAVPDGDLPALKALLQRILRDPNNLQQNLRDAAACLPTAKEVERAESLGRDVYEYVRQIDYDQYYESMAGATARDGRAAVAYYDFSLRSARAAQARLREFLTLMPADQREAAAVQLASSPF